MKRDMNAAALDERMPSERRFQKRESSGEHCDQTRPEADSDRTCFDVRQGIRFRDTADGTASSDECCVIRGDDACNASAKAGGPEAGLFDTADPDPPRQRSEWNNVPLTPFL